MNGLNGKFYLITDTEYKTDYEEKTYTPINALSDRTIALKIGDYRLLDQYDDMQLWDTVPFIDSGRTMVPLRAISENMGCDVAYFYGKITIEGNSTITLNVGNKTASIYEFDKESGKFVTRTIEMEVAPQIVDERTFVPIRYIAEFLGKSVDYKDEFITVSDQKLDINSKVSALAKDFVPAKITYDEYPKVDGSTATIPFSQGLFSEMLGVSADAALSGVEHTKTTNSYNRLINVKGNLKMYKKGH